MARSTISDMPDMIRERILYRVALRADIVLVAIQTLADLSGHPHNGATLRYELDGKGISRDHAAILLAMAQLPHVDEPT